MPDARDDPDGYEYIYIGSALASGGVILNPDGSGRSMSEAEALAAAMPQWIEIPEHLDDAVRTYVAAMSRPENFVRLAAVTAIGEVARRYGRVPRRQDARAAVLRALDDADPEVRAAGTAALALIDMTAE